MEWPVESFEARAARIPVHGIGLSVEVFSPDVLALYQALDSAGVPPAYLELFKAPTQQLALVRAALPGMPLAYHAEGLWLIDPAMRTATPWREAVGRMARHAETIGAGWVNHECAGKQIGGYSFGTYLPPLLTKAAAKAVAANARVAQDALDEWAAGGAAPLLLLELPPLTYFGFGDLPVSEFFAQIVDRASCGASCGLVLDIGHLWTHWRYRERRSFRSLESFTEAFCATFPLDRVIQIHLAGLGLHDRDESLNRLPFWIDKHEAPVPDVLFDLLWHIMEKPGLTALKGIALEVDGKEIPVIVEEFGRFKEEFASQARFTPSPLPFRQGSGQASPSRREGLLRIPSPLRGEGKGGSELGRLYKVYARVISGHEGIAGTLLAPFVEGQFAEGIDPKGLHRYATCYLPHELLCWGGDLVELFPAIWRSLEARGIVPMDFVRFWFWQPRPIIAQYDFFYLKLDRWVAFIADVAPELLEHATNEAENLRALHADLNDEAVVTASRA